MATYDETSSVSKNRSSYFGIKLEKEEVDSELMKNLNRDINTDDPPGETVSEKSSLSSDNFCVGNLVKIKVGSRIGDYNSNIYRVHEILEVPPDETPSICPSGRGYRNILLEPFDKRGKNIRVVFLFNKSGDWTANNYYFYSGSIEKYTKILNSHGDIRSEPMPEEDNIHKNNKVREVKILPDEILLEEVDVEAKEVLPYII